MSYRSTKLFDGFSTVFRQWAAEGTHCKYLHGYDVEIKVTFEGKLDHRNWVWDFGGMKRAKGTIDGMNPKAWFDYMFDHTTIVAEDDPSLEIFKQMNDEGIVQLRIVPNVGAEKFAKFVFDKVNKFVQEETEGRVRVVEVEVFENNRNSAIFSEDSIDKTMYLAKQYETKSDLLTKKYSSRRDDDGAEDWANYFKNK
jgi:6-pyruvoyltetrahydropterin/6-carboxytetrahydropterin synthase